MPVKLRKLIDEFKENDRNELILNDQSIQDINDVPDICKQFYDHSFPLNILKIFPIFFTI